jgi:excisionase family DNA binding protein
MAEKLLTIGEVAAYLKIPEEEVKRLVDIGEVPAYRIGGSFLRFRKEQIDAIRSEISEVEEKEPQRARPTLDDRGRPTHPYTDLERDIKKREPVVRQYDYTPQEKVRDFFYFNDFYIISLAAIAVLLFIIFR